MRSKVGRLTVVYEIDWCESDFDTKEEFERFEVTELAVRECVEEFEDGEIVKFETEEFDNASR